MLDGGFVPVAFRAALGINGDYIALPGFSPPPTGTGGPGCHLYGKTVVLDTFRLGSDPAGPETLHRQRYEAL